MPRKLQAGISFCSFYLCSGFVVLFVIVVLFVVGFVVFVRMLHYHIIKKEMKV